MKIPIQNLYYLLCFAWNRVPQEFAIDVSTIPASADVLELCSYLLITGTDLLLRRGLDRGYLLHEEKMVRVRGRIDMTQTLRYGVNASPQLVCQFDDLSPNVMHNQILRASIEALLHVDRVNSELKNGLRTAYGKLSGIDRIEVTSAMFGQIQLHRNNRYYALLLFVCRLVHSLKLPDHGSGHSKFNDLISDEKVMEKVFEDFLRNFYRLKQHQFHSVGSTQMTWNATAENLDDLGLLPIMRTDVTLRSKDRIVIMDAKYYKAALQEHHGTPKAISANLYQLMAYLRTEGISQQSIRPEGILIYPVGDSFVDKSFVIEGFPVRIYLKKGWQDADKLSRDGKQDAYEREAKRLYGLLREAWERAIEEVLLGGLVERFRPSIETKRLEPLVDITDQDYKTVDAAMTKCSTWLTGHDQAAAARAPVPGADELKKDIEALEVWIKAIRKRRE